MPVRLLPFGVYSARANMVLDILLQQRARENLSPATFRLYGWSEPTLSLGKGQRETQIEKVRPEGDSSFAIVQRPTGGAVAVHGRDISYALTSAFPGEDLPRSPKQLYRKIHRGIFKALQSLGCDVTSVGENEGEDYLPKIYCGLSHRPYDIVHQGRKVAGSAQRLSSRAILQHGFILIDEDFSWVRQALGERGKEIARSCATLMDMLPE